VLTDSAPIHEIRLVGQLHAVNTGRLKQPDQMLMAG
jgi:hypothetical protein